MRRVAGLAVIMAHPDDEVFVAGTVAAWTAAGHRAWVLALTRGERGEDRTGAAPDLGATRARELADSAAALGAEASALGFADGALTPRREVVDAARGWLAARDVDVVLTLGPDGAYGHADHLAATAVVERAAGLRTVLHAAFEPGTFRRVHRAMARHAPARLAIADPAQLGVDAWDYTVDIRAHAAAKLAAAAAHVTQLDGADPHSFLGRNWIDGQLGHERYVHARGPIPEQPLWTRP